MASQGIMANQRAAGGTSGPDISGATATPEKVLAGETFFAGSTKEMQTGTLALDGTATAAQVLSGYTFYNTDAKTKLTGTYTASLQTKTGNGTYSSKASGGVQVSLYLGMTCAAAYVTITYGGSDGGAMIVLNNGSYVGNATTQNRNPASFASISGSYLNINHNGGGLNGVTVQYTYTVIGI